MKLNYSIMKVIYSILFLLIPFYGIGQTGINYQGAATNSEGAKLVNQNISLRTSVLQGGINGTTSYSETHNTTTDQFGLFNVVIGQGEVVSGDFEGILWGADAHFLKVELDATGGSDYSLVSTTQMMSVPYALYAENSSIDSSKIAMMIEDVIGNSPYYDASINQNSNFTNDSLINGYRCFYTYVSDNKTKLFESDSAHSFSNQLYSIEGGNSSESLIRSLYIDEENQDLYFTVSPSLLAGATKLMKTSISNFNPQVVYVIPTKTNELSDFEIHPLTGDFYWSKNGYYGGVYYYDISANEVITIVNGTNFYIKSFCFDSNGDLFYAKDNQLFDIQSNSIFSSGSGSIQKVIYNELTNSFIMCSSDRIFDDQGNILFINPSGGGNIRDLDVNHSTQRILFNTGYASVSMDVDGNNLNYNGVYTSEIHLIKSID